MEALNKSILFIKRYFFILMFFIKEIGFTLKFRRNLRWKKYDSCVVFLWSQHLSRAAEKLSTLGRKREAVKVMLKLVAIKRAFAEDSITPEERQDNLLEVPTQASSHGLFYAVKLARTKLRRIHAFLKYT